jgi:hypothetical protein
MIVVKLELWPGGDEKRAIDLGKAHIANESNLAEISRYSVKLLKGAAYSAKAGGVYKTGEVPAYPRKDKRWGPWELLALALEATVGYRVAGLKRHLARLAADERARAARSEAPASEEGA